MTAIALMLLMVGLAAAADGLGFRNLNTPISMLFSVVVGGVSCVVDSEPKPSQNALSPLLGRQQPYRCGAVLKRSSDQAERRACVKPLRVCDQCPQTVEMVHRVKEAVLHGMRGVVVVRRVVIDGEVTPGLHVAWRRRGAFLPDVDLRNSRSIVASSSASRALSDMRWTVEPASDT